MATELSANDIVPEEYQNRLMMWRDEFTRGYFEIGDIANQIVAVNIQRGMKIDQHSIYAAVGKFCGKSGRTVRDYAEVASFFPVAVREEFDVLPFSHFRLAKSCGLKYMDVLEYSLSNPSVSVEALDFVFGCRNTSIAEESVTVAAPPMLGVDISQYEGNLPFPTINPIPRTNEIYSLANLIYETERILTWNIDKDIKSELMVSLEGLKSVLSRLSKHSEVLEVSD